MAFRRRTEELPSVFSLNDALDAGSARLNASRRAQLQRLLRCADGSAWWCAGGKEKAGMRKGWEGKRGQETGDSNCCRCAGCPDKVTELSACTFTYLLWSGLHYTELLRPLLCTSPPVHKQKLSLWVTQQLSKPQLFPRWEQCQERQIGEAQRCQRLSPSFPLPCSPPLHSVLAVCWGSRLHPEMANIGFHTLNLDVTSLKYNTAFPNE